LHQKRASANQMTRGAIFKGGKFREIGGGRGGCGSGRVKATGWNLGKIRTGLGGLYLRITPLVVCRPPQLSPQCLLSPPSLLYESRRKKVQEEGGRENRQGRQGPIRPPCAIPSGRFWLSSRALDDAPHPLPPPPPSQSPPPSQPQPFTRARPVSRAVACVCAARPWGAGIRASTR